MSAIGRIIDVCKRNNFNYSEQENNIIINTGIINEKKLKKVVLITEYFEHARYRKNKLIISGTIQYYDNEIAYRITTKNGINLNIELEVEIPINKKEIKYISETEIQSILKQINKYNEIEIDYYNGSIIFYISKTIKGSYISIIELLNKLLRIIEELLFEIKVNIKRGCVF